MWYSLPRGKGCVKEKRVVGRVWFSWGGYFGPIAILSDFIPVTNQINGELKGSKRILFIDILPSMVSLVG